MIYLQTNNKPTNHLKIRFVFYVACFATSDHNTVSVLNKGNLQDFITGLPWQQRSCGTI